MNGDEADGPLGLQRAKPLDDGAGGKSKPAVAGDFNSDKIAVDRSGGRFGRDRKLPAELLLVDRHQAAAAAGKFAENAERAVLGAIDQLDDATGDFLTGPFDANERAVADAGHLARPGAAWRGNVDHRRRAVRLLIPFGRARQQFTVAVAGGDVGNAHGRQRAGMMQPLALAIDLARLGKLAQHPVERGAVGILGAEGARDLARANLAAALADEGGKLLAGGQGS